MGCAHCGRCESSDRLERHCTRYASACYLWSAQWTEFQQVQLFDCDAYKRRNKNITHTTVVCDSHRQDGRRGRRYLKSVGSTANIFRRTFSSILVLPVLFTRSRNLQDRGRILNTLANLPTMYHCGTMNWHLKTRDS